MTYIYAGQYNPEAIIDVFGNAQASAPVTLYEADGVTLASRYTNRTKATPASNPWIASSVGEVSFFADPGPKMLAVTIGDVVTTKAITVPIDPQEAQFIGDTVNVQEMGAQGDGIADDTAAIQNAYNSLSAGGTLYFPAGTYIVSPDAVTFFIITLTKQNVKFVGEGRGLTTIKIKANAGDYIAMFCCLDSKTTDLSGTEFHGITFDHNINNNVPSSVSVYSASTGNFGHWRATLRIDKGSNIVVDSCKFTNYGGGQVYVIANSNQTTYINDVNRVWITNNVFDNQSINSSTIDYDATSILLRGNSLIVKGNQFIGGPTNYYSCRIAIQANGPDTVVEGNTIDKFYRGILVGTYDYAQVSDSVTVVGNTMTNMNGGIQILSSGTDGNSHIGLTTGPVVRGVVIADNVIRTNKAVYSRAVADSSTPYGIRLDPLSTMSVENVKIINNIITNVPVRGSGGNGIRWEDSGDRSMTDGVVAAGFPTITSGTANFLPSDVGKAITESGNTHIPAGTTILSVTAGNTTTATMSANALADGNPITFDVAKVSGDTKGVELSGNTIINAGNNGIAVNSDVDQMSIKDNRIVDVAQAQQVIVTDGTTDTSNPRVVTSATAAFDQSFVGSTISGSGIPSSTTISTVTSPTSVTISKNVTATATGVTLTIGSVLSALNSTGVRIASKITDLVIRNNMLVDTRTPHLMAYGVLLSSAALTNAVVAGNSMRLADGAYSTVDQVKINNTHSIAFIDEIVNTMTTTSPGQAALGSRFVETSTGLQYTQTTPVAGTTWYQNYRGGVAIAATKTTAYTATLTDTLIPCDATSAGFTVTLPTAVGKAGKVYSVKKIDASGNAVTVGTTSAQTIDGATTYALPSQYNSVTVTSDGSNWIVNG